MGSNLFKKQCVSLRKRGLTLNEIVSATGKGKTTVYYHIKSIPLPEDRRRAWRENGRQRLIALNHSRKGRSALNRHPINFDRWTVDRVSLVSHLLFDGTINAATCVYSNRSKVLLQKVEACMSQIYPYSPAHSVNYCGVHSIGYYNVELADFMREKSAALLKQMPNFSKDLKRAFLRAFFDDEGCIDFNIKTRKKRVRGYQHNIDILNLIHKLLNDFGITSKVYPSANEIMIRGAVNLRKFEQEINFSKGVRINGKRSNSVWKKSFEKREILRRAIESYK